MQAIGSELWLLLEALVVPVTGYLAFYVYGGIKRAATFLDNIPADLQRILVVASAWGIGLVERLINVQLPDTLAMFDIGQTESVIAGIFAIVIHKLKK